jgi:uncharacterized membrane protein YkvA (DUF1232 family)
LGKAARLVKRWNILQMHGRLRDWAGTIRRDVHAIYLASRDPRVPWYAKALAISTAVYALSPIDLIPDFIPVLGHLDELIILPLVVILVVRLIPSEIMMEHRAAAVLAAEKPTSKMGAAVIIGLWVLFAALSGWLAYRYFVP